MDEREILRLRGELSAATNAVAIALTILAGMGDSGTLDAIRRKFEYPSFEISNDGMTDDPHWREGVNRFNRRLLEGLLSGYS